MSFRVHVRVMPRAGLLDPQGQAVEHALAQHPDPLVPRYALELPVPARHRVPIAVRIVEPLQRRLAAGA